MSVATSRPVQLVKAMELLHRELELLEKSSHLYIRMQATLLPKTLLEMMNYSVARGGCYYPSWMAISAQFDTLLTTFDRTVLNFGDLHTEFERVNPRSDLYYHTRALKVEQWVKHHEQVKKQLWTLETWLRETSNAMLGFVPT